MLYANLFFDCQPRTNVRIRIRSIVIRVQVRHTAISVRVVVRPIDHTTYTRKSTFILYMVGTLVPTRFALTLCYGR